MTVVQIVILILCIILLGVVVFPLINRRQFKNLPNEQAKGAYFDEGSKQYDLLQKSNAGQSRRFVLCKKQA